MSGVVTAPYLRRRFWISKLILIVALAGAAAVAVVTLKAQESRTDYAIALQHLGNSLNGLEAELDHLAYQSRRGIASRSRARAAFDSALGRFHEIAAAIRRANGVVEGVSTASLDYVGKTAGNREPDESGAPGGYSPMGPMPESIARIWVAGSGAPSAGPSEHLEYVLDRLLRLTGALLSADGVLSTAEADRLQTIKASMAALVSPRLEGITVLLDEDLHRSIDWALIWFLALLAIAAVVATFNVFFIFRPLERAVMGAQASLKAERDRALEAAAAKRSFLSVMSHELRTPMNGVLGFAELLLASDLKPAQRRQVEVIRSSGKTLLALVNDILDLSRMEAGSLDLADEVFSLEDVVGDVLSLVRAGIAGKDIETAVYVDPSVPERLRGDPERLRQILTNLVGNAVKFTDRGAVTVEARWLERESGDGPTLELAVTDTGPGIPAEEQARIFERFTQGGRPGRQAAEGTGLGLAICRELTERMGGGIGVQSAPGRGATFRARLRLEPADPLGAGAGGATSPTMFEGLGALVVDDNAVVARLTRLQLEAWGVSVRGVAGAGEALAVLDAARAAGRPYRIALIGRKLAEGDPIGLARAIGADPRLSGMALLLLAGSGGEETRSHDAGIVSLAEPPLLPRALRAALSRLSELPDPGAQVSTERVEGAPPRILLAEDHAVSRQLVVSVLEGAGYCVEAVGDGAAAVEAAAREAHDLILMDIRMPGLDGVEATRRIRALGGTSGEIPIVALTANASAEDCAEYRAAGMDDVVPKPIDVDRLLATTTRVLRDSRRPDSRPAAADGERPGRGAAAPRDEADRVAAVR